MPCRMFSLERINEENERDRAKRKRGLGYFETLFRIQKQKKQIKVTNNSYIQKGEGILKTTTEISAENIGENKNQLSKVKEQGHGIINCTVLEEDLNMSSNVIILTEKLVTHNSSRQLEMYPSM